MQGQGPARFEFEGFRLDLRCRTLTLSGREIQLRPKSFDVLAFLVENAGELVTKDMIFAAVWPDIIVSDESLPRCISDIRAALGDTKKQIIRTVPGRGYQFSVPAIIHTDNGAVPDFFNQQRKPGISYRLWSVGLLVCAVIVAGTWTFAGLSTHERDNKGQVSIAVLPFDNMSNDAAQDYFVDGLTEDLIARLAKLGGLFVIARNTAFAYKDRDVQIADVARELNVQFILEGSVRRSGNKIRINARLINTKGGGHLWTDTFDRELTDVFALQDDVVGKIAAAAHVTLTPSEAQKVATAPTDNLEAYEFFLKGRIAHQRFNPFDGSVNEALRNYRWATTKDPDFADAYAYDADLALWVMRMQWDMVMKFEAARERAVQSLNKALELDPDNTTALLAQAQLESAGGNHEQAIKLTERTTHLVPGDHRGYLLLGLYYGAAGQVENAVLALETALRLNPLPGTEDTLISSYAYFFARQYDQAVAMAELATKAIPKSHLGYYPLAAGLARLGRSSDARDAIRRVLKIIPYANQHLEEGNLAYAQDAVLDDYVGALAEAGLPQWPYGFTGEGLISMSPQEVRDEVWGRKLAGYEKPWGHFEATVTKDGKFKFRRINFAVDGIYIEQDAQMCSIYENTVQPPNCINYYRNPNGSQVQRNQYISVSKWGIYTYALVD